MWFRKKSLVRLFCFHLCLDNSKGLVVFAGAWVTQMKPYSDSWLRAPFPRQTNLLLCLQTKTPQFQNGLSLFLRELSVPSGIHHIQYWQIWGYSTPFGSFITVGREGEKWCHMGLWSQLLTTVSHTMDNYNRAEEMAQRAECWLWDPEDRV